jgi:winged helix DNA-binding protein
MNRARAVGRTASARRGGGTAGSGEIARLRLARQRLVGDGFATPADAVRWLGVVQAQDYAGSLWALGLRVRDATESTIEEAIASRSIVRTWPNRRTIHFVAADDARWVLAITGPRMIAQHAGTLERHYGIDRRLLARARKTVTRALGGAPPMPRGELYARLEADGLPTDEARGLHLVVRLAQEGLICLGPRSGKQATFVLFDEWVPRGRSFDRPDALAELARRFFQSHGPATLRDFGWWSGLAAADARAAFEAVKGTLAEIEIEGARFWMPTDASATPAPRGTAHLLPPYDEHVVAYADRGAVLDPAHRERARHGIFSPVVVVDGRIVGTWKRTVRGNSVKVALTLFGALTASAERAVGRAARRYAAFLGLEPVLA